MTINVGTVDRIARAILGVVLLYLAFASGSLDASVWKWIAAAAGVIMLGTSAMKFCPLYRVFGMRTCPV